MKKTIALFTLVAAIGATPALLNAKETPKSAEQEKLQKEAKISMDEAKEIALKKVPDGKIASSELEREHGKLIYSFDIKVPKKSGITEVNVDAIDGKVIAVHHENAAKEAAEAKQEAKEKAAKH